MSHPGDISASTGIELGFFRKNRQDAICELQQTFGASFANAPSPFLGSDVISNWHMRQTGSEAVAQTHVGAHVIDQHHTIGGALLQHQVDSGLQSNRGHNQREGFPQANRAHRRGISKQLSSSSLHPLTPQSEDF